MNRTMARGVRLFDGLRRSLGVIVLAGSLLVACGGQPTSLATLTVVAPAATPVSPQIHAPLDTPPSKPSDIPTSVIRATETATPPASISLTPAEITATITPTLETPAYITVEAVTNTQTISDTVIPRIAGGELVVQASDLLTRTFKLPSGAGLILSQEVIDQLVHEIPTDKLAQMSPDQIHAEFARLVGSSKWAQILQHFTDIRKVENSNQFLKPSKDALVIFAPDGSVIVIENFVKQEDNPIAILSAVIDEKTNILSYSRRNLTTTQRNELGGSLKRYCSYVWSEKLQTVVLTDGYSIYTYFNLVKKEWITINQDQLQDFKVLSPEQEEQFIVDALRNKLAFYRRIEKQGPFIFTGYTKTTNYPNTIITVGGENGFTQNQAIQIAQQIEWMIKNSPTARNIFIEQGEVRFIVKDDELMKRKLPDGTPQPYVSGPDKIGTIWGYRLISDFFNRSSDEKIAIIIDIFAHEGSRIFYGQQIPGAEGHDNKVLPLQEKIIKELLPYLTENQQRILLGLLTSDKAKSNHTG